MTTDRPTCLSVRKNTQVTNVTCYCAVSSFHQNHPQKRPLSSPVGVAADAGTRAVCQYVSQGWWGRMEEERVGCYAANHREREGEREHTSAAVPGFSCAQCSEQTAPRFLVPSLSHSWLSSVYLLDAGCLYPRFPVATTDLLRRWNDCLSALHGLNFGERRNPRGVQKGRKRDSPFPPRELILQ